MRGDEKGLSIAAIPTRHGNGLIGVIAAPGSRGGALEDDLDAVARWGAAVVVTLTEAHELVALGLEGIGTEVTRRSMLWRHWPIRDFSVPDAVFEAAWPERSKALRDGLATNANVLLHCRGGLGRSGMVAARLLVDLCVPPAEAMARVRAARPGAIETAAQERWAAGDHNG